MITRLVDHGLHVILSRNLTSPGLHVTYQLHPSIYTTSAMNSSSHRCIVATTSSFLYRLGHQSTLVLSGAEVLCIADYLQTNALPDLVVVEQEEYPHALQRKVTGKATSKVVRKTAGRTRPGLTFRTSTSVSTIYHTT